MVNGPKDQSRVQPPRLSRGLYNRIVKLQALRGHVVFEETIEEAISLLERWSALAGADPIAQLIAGQKAFLDLSRARVQESQQLSLELNRLERAILLIQLTKLAEPGPNAVLTSDANSKA